MAERSEPPVATSPPGADESWDVVVVGASLAGLAAAARLARHRHRVVVLEADDRPGGRLAPYPIPDPDHGDDPVLVDDWPSMFSFPAPWRDLFRKSGRPFDDELARAGQGLVPAPAVRHRFTDGTELVLPTDRGVQFSVLSRAYGATVAGRWRDLLDRYDEVWQALRPLGQEAPWRDAGQLRSRRHVLQPDRTVADVARGIGEPHLAALILEVAHRLGSPPERTPAWCAVQLSVERRFGRWMTAEDERPERASLLLDRLVDRLRTRRVDVRTGTEVTGILHQDGRVAGVRAGEVLHHAPAVILTHRPGPAYAWLDELRGLPRPVRRGVAAERRALRRTTPALTPSVRHEIAVDHTDEPDETVVHTDRGPVVTWARPLPDGRTLASEHNWTRARPDPAAGIAWHGARTALRRPPISSALPGLELAGPHSRGGHQLSSVVLSAALASYACHDRLVGSDRTDPVSSPDRRERPPAAD